MSRAVPLMLAVAMAAVAGAAVVVGIAMGLRVNLSSSAPVGLWRLIQVDTAVRIDDYVLLCPPRLEMITRWVQAGGMPAGSCENGEAPFLKRVVALSGQHFAVDRLGVWIDGALLDRSEPLGAWRRHLDPGRGVVPTDMLMALQTDHPRSLDSRYFGPIAAQRVLGRMVPVWTSPAP